MDLSYCLPDAPLFFLYTAEDQAKGPGTFRRPFATVFIAELRCVEYLAAVVRWDVPTKAIPDAKRVHRSAPACVSGGKVLLTARPMSRNSARAVRLSRFA